MVTIHLDPGRLSLEELSNLTEALRGRCADCIERGVPEPCKHPGELEHFLDALAAAVERERDTQRRRRDDEALAVDPDTGEAPAGA